ncbi:MAG: tocopherol cyclase family protein [Oscillospiraceae bacterium]|nr:tocopherol cyclase family protein [Oscillospiraceae bacterium]
MSNTSDITRNAFMLKGPLADDGYDWWWHSFTGRDAETGEERAFFIEFFTCNPLLGGAQPVFGQLPNADGSRNRPSYLMVKAGSWGRDKAQLHRFFGWNEVAVRDRTPFYIHAGDCFLDETGTRGSVSVSAEDALAHPEWMCGSGSMSWDLVIDKRIAFNVGYGASRPLRDSDAFEMFWHAEGMKTFYSGEVVYNGRRYLVKPENCYGYADKNWGHDFTSPWVWLSSNHLVSRSTGEELPNSAFNIGGGRPKIGPLALERKLLSQFTYEGTDYEFNFSKVWTLTRTQFNCSETDDCIVWHVEQETPLHKMVTDVTCPKQDMLLVNYEAPNGEKKHNRLWNGGTGTGTVSLYRMHHNQWQLIDTVDADHIGCEYGEYCEG